MVSQLLVLLLFLCSSIGWSAAREYWVRPDSTSDCDTKQPCLSLSTAIRNTTTYFTSNSVFHFLPGSHTINETSWVIVRGVSNVSLVGSSLGGSYTTIECNGRMSFTFDHVQQLNISHMEFLSCGLVMDLKYCSHMQYLLDVSCPHVALLVFRSSSVVLEYVRVMNSYGYGLLEWNVVGTSLINCQFYCSNWRSHKEKDRHERVSTYHRLSCPSSSKHNEPGGNVLFVLLAAQSKYPLVNIFNHSEFAYGFAGEANSSEVIGGGGIGMYISSVLLAHKVYIQIRNCSLHDNVSPVGANMFLEVILKSYYFAVHISGCKFHDGNSTSSGGGLALYLHLARDSCTSPSQKIIIEHCTFNGNIAEYGSGVYMHVQTVWEYCSLEPSSEISTQVTISDSLFFENIVSVGGAIFLSIDWHLKLPFIVKISESKFILNRATIITADTAVVGGISVHRWPKSGSITFASVTFLKNTAEELVASQYNYMCAIVHFAQAMNVTFVNSTFTENKCTCISMEESVLHFEGTLGFYRNMGFDGGALSFLVYNLVDIKLHTVMYVINNTAVQYGGGILVNEECVAETPCFFQIDGFNGSITEVDVRIVMEGNKAGRAGDSIFGGCLESCYLKTPSIQPFFLTFEVFQSLFQIDGAFTQSEVAANPHKICFCGQYFEVSSSVAEIAGFKGETLHILAKAVGQYEFASPAIVRTRIISDNSAELGDRQSIQELSNECGNLTYSVRTSQESIHLYLSVETSTVFSDERPALLSISFLPCPLGFDLSGDPPECECAPQLKKPGIRCDINNQLIHRPASMWIGNYSNEIVVHTNCPFDYCRPEDNDINLYTQDHQCSFNRSGVLCGACQPGLSLVLGSSHCRQCPDTYILLFIPFALAGFALIFLLLKCNLTVSTGTLNGLIFYANIVRANDAIFFPVQTENIGTVTNFLSVYIAWLNLDLGVDVCFSHSMDTYVRTWLQFVFPVYIWILVGLLVYSSRYSTTVSRLSGSNTVSVLATLFLLSYAKLLRNITDAISFTTLTDQHGDTVAVWLLDGNRLAFKGGHIVLVVVSVVTLVAFVLPFTLLVLLAPCLQARSGYRLLRWVNKIKPLLDAYQGPYKEKFRCWTGLMFVVRIILLTIFGGNALGDPRINLFAIVTVVLVLMKYGDRVYKKLWLNLLEYFFLLNLGIFSAATLFLKSLSLEGFSAVEKQITLTLIMAGSVFVVFVGILTYHFFQELSKWQLLKKLCVKLHSDCNRRTNVTDSVNRDINDASTSETLKPATVSVVAMSELRESLLTDN